MEFLLKLEMLKREAPGALLRADILADAAELGCLRGNLGALAAGNVPVNVAEIARVLERAKENRRAHFVADVEREYAERFCTECGMASDDTVACPSLQCQIAREEHRSDFRSDDGF